MMKYKGFTGCVQFDSEAEIFHGEVVDTRDVITFQGKTAKEIKKAFKDSIDDYIEFCKVRGEKPEKPFSGKFVMRIPPKLHYKVYLKALQSGKSLNAWISEVLKEAT
ncbi:MAG: type II toxin-antitoxin system HicB family antitoxin [Pseudomonadota bacterium]